jgi:hypothetical protein
MAALAGVASFSRANAIILADPVSRFWTNPIAVDLVRFIEPPRAATGTAGFKALQRYR